MKLWVKRGKGRKARWFRPRLTIRDTNFSAAHWQEQHFSPPYDPCHPCGAGTFRDKSLADAVNEYMSELKRMNYDYEWRD